MRNKTKNTARGKSWALSQSLRPAPDVFRAVSVNINGLCTAKALDVDYMLAG